LVDGVLSFFAFLSVCMPSFLLVLAVQKWFVLDLGWFPLSGLVTTGSTWSFSDILRHIALPCMTLAALEAGRLSRYVRASMIEVLSSDYIRWSGANGVSPARLLWVHATKNAMLPFITYLGMSLPVLFAGTVVIESMFGLPGIGQLSYRAVLARDYPLVLGITFLLSFAAVLGNMAADIACTIADPQTRSRGSGHHG
jgi:peptide/nickel transport system permease protein